MRVRRRNGKADERMEEVVVEVHSDFYTVERTVVLPLLSL